MSKVEAPYIGIDQEHHMKVISGDSAEDMLKGLDLQHNQIGRPGAERTLSYVEEHPADQHNSRVVRALARLENGLVAHSAKKEMLKGDSIHTAQRLLSGELAPQDANPKHVRVANKLMGRQHKLISNTVTGIMKNSEKDGRKLVRSLDRSAKSQGRYVDRMVRRSNRQTKRILRSI